MFDTNMPSLLALFALFPWVRQCAPESPEVVDTIDTKQSETHQTLEVVGAIDTKGNEVVKVTNCFTENGNFVVAIGMAQKNEVLQRVCNRKIQMSIGSYHTNVRFENAGSFQSVRLLRQHIRTIPNGPTAAIVPFYVGFVPEKYQGESPGKIGFLMATMWDNIFRVQYALSMTIHLETVFNINSAETAEYIDLQEYYTGLDIKGVNDSQHHDIAPTIIKYYGKHVTETTLHNCFYKHILFGIEKNLLVEELGPKDKGWLQHKKRVWNKLRERMCGNTTRTHKEYLLIIVQTRQKTRKIVNIDDIVNLVEKEAEQHHRQIQVRLVDFGSISIDEQIQTIQEADVLIAQHGAGLLHIAHMKEGGIVLELFPFGFRKTIYMHLSNLLGHKYMWWQNHHLENSSGLDSSFKWSRDLSLLQTRNFYRQQNTKVDLHEFEILYKYMLKYFVDKQPDDRFLLYLPWEQFNNQIIGLKTAILLAKELGRTLVLPLVGYRQPTENARINIASEKPIKFHQNTEIVFRPNKYEWDPMEKYFDTTKLSCDFIPMSVFLALISTIDLLIREQNKIRVNNEQTQIYYTQILNLKIAQISTKIPRYLHQHELAAYYENTAEYKTLAIGMLFDRVYFSSTGKEKGVWYVDYTRNQTYKNLCSEVVYRDFYFNQAKKILSKLMVDKFDLSMHVRRGDYGSRCNVYNPRERDLYRSCLQTTEEIATLIDGLEPSTIYISSDILTKKELLAQCKIPGKRIIMKEDLHPDHQANMTPIQTMIVEQILCTSSKFFIGNYFSSYTRRIVEMINDMMRVTFF